MTTKKMIGIMGALGLALASSIPQAQGRPDGSPGVPVLVNSQLAALASEPDSPEGSAAKREENLGQGIVKGKRTPSLGRPTAPGQAKSLNEGVEEFKQAEKKFLEEQKKLRNEYKNATKTRREEIRSLLREKNRDFIEEQKKRREEIRQRMAQMKDEIKEHKDLIDQVPEPTHRRKGGAD